MLNKIFSPTKLICERIIKIDDERLEKSICQSTTAGLLTVNRELKFYSQIDNQTFVFNNENLILISLNDFNLLLKQICIDNDENFQDQLIDMMNNQLNDEDLNKILYQNQYSNCER